MNPHQQILDTPDELGSVPPHAAEDSEDAEDAEDAWLNRLADEAEAEADARGGWVSLDEMAAMVNAAGRIAPNVAGTR
ncbi:hypothetical protein [Streptomyces mayteni]